MFIARMNKGSWGKIRAFFDVQTEEGFTIKGFKLVEGANGLFVGFPSQKGSDDEYYDTIWAEKDLKVLISAIASKVYGSDDGVKCQDNYVEREQKAADYQERVEDSQQDPSEELPF
tara:strand:+ start:241 stop:588 length:348 start_codon:yes stop_codon:yes gene_type:complete